jgi:hypothetical protein
MPRSMAQCLPRFWPGNAIGDQPVIALKRRDGMVRAGAEIAVGIHRSIHVAITNMTQLLLQLLHRATFVPVPKCRGCFGGMILLLGFFHVQTFTSME